MKINVKVNAQRNHLKLHAKWPGNLNCPGVLETSRQESWQIEMVHFSRPNLKHDFMPSCHTPQAAFPSNWHKYSGYDADRNHRCGLEMSVYCLWFDIIKGVCKSSHRCLISFEPEMELNHTLCQKRRTGNISTV